MNCSEPCLVGSEEKPENNVMQTPPHLNFFPWVPEPCFGGLSSLFPFIHSIALNGKEVQKHIDHAMQGWKLPRLGTLEWTEQEENLCIQTSKRRFQ